MHAPDRHVPAPLASIPRRARRPVLASLLAVSILAASACTDRAGSPPEAAAAAGAPSVAPDVVFRTLSGDALALREAEGPTLVSFWSTSCGVCLHEMPALARLRADYAPRGFEMIAVAMPHDRPDTVLELAEARAWSFPVALDIDGRVLAAFEPVPGTPTSFLIGADGIVLERRVGPVDVDALRLRLDALLARAAVPRA